MLIMNLVIDKHYRKTCGLEIYFLMTPYYRQVNINLQQIFKRNVDYTMSLKIIMS